MTTDDLRGFQGRRLEAMEHIAKQFKGNKQTEKRSFDLPDLAQFAETARSRAHAIDEFVMIERHVALGAWKAARLAPPERRVLMGETLLVRYRECAQAPDVPPPTRRTSRKPRKRRDMKRTICAPTPTRRGRN